jgi:hypothetical protein
MLAVVGRFGRQWARPVERVTSGWMVAQPACSRSRSRPASRWGVAGSSSRNSSPPKRPASSPPWSSARNRAPNGQHAVADQVTVGVVERLEVVQVQQDDGVAGLRAEQSQVDFTSVADAGEYDAVTEARSRIRLARITMEGVPSANPEADTTSPNTDRRCGSTVTSSRGPTTTAPGCSHYLVAEPLATRRRSPPVGRPRPAGVVGCGRATRVPSPPHPSSVPARHQGLR